jgi:dTDP-4-amino-4,6-dideoxygalactose transaminase
MVSTNDPDLAQRVRMLRSHGSSPKYYHSEVGGNFRLDGLQAAVLRVKLRHLDDWTGGRQKNAATYQRLFREAELSMARAGDQWASSPGEANVALPAALPDRRHIFNQFVIRAKRRDELAAFLREAGIYSEVYYPVPLHLQECFQALGYHPGDLQVSEEAARETLALPVYPELTVEMQASVADSISRFYEV